MITRDPCRQHHLAVPESRLRLGCCSLARCRRSILTQAPLAAFGRAARGGAGSVMTHYTRFLGPMPPVDEAREIARAAFDIGIRVTLAVFMRDRNPLFISGLGAHLTWTLPFGLLVMFAIFNRFDHRYEEAARDLGATPWGTFRYVILPIILPSVIRVGLFSFTLSWDEIARSSQAIGEHNTLPMELQALTTTVTTPDIYALGTATTGVSFTVIAVALGAIALLRARQARYGSDAGKA
jgi:Binding-protein-dependent transport system inner membrane component